MIFYSYLKNFSFVIIEFLQILLTKLEQLYFTKKQEKKYKSLDLVTIYTYYIIYDLKISFT